MPSLISGYNYDIFISYRQKDNKGDRWVSEFVEALKTELESTFKEEISVYFDINPHDGLLETYDVDASLNEKLKSLIFIPIISRTYCDPKSFAWEHEFKAFADQASKDQFGLKIKLPNGNVTSRVLPIQIHDLKPEDKGLVEKELGGFLRSVEFIYKEPGVNRPLSSNEDHPDNNLNKTYYRNQINKVANAIDEIISGFKTEPVLLVKEKILNKEALKGVRRVERKEVRENPAKTSKRKLLTTVIIAAIIIIAAILAYPKIFNSNPLEKLRSSGERISVAVMPFQNMTNDTIWNVWQDGIQDNLITSLSNSEELKVRQTESTTGLLQSKGYTNYASITPSVAGKISRKLDASIFIHGSIKQSGATIRVNAKLIDSKTEEVFKSFQLDGTAGNILTIMDSLSWMVKNFLIISGMQNELSLDFKGDLSTSSFEAYKYFIYGQKAFFKRDNSTALKMYSQALAIDSNHIWAAIMLPFAYRNQGLYEEAKKSCLKIYDKRDQMTMQQKIFTNYIYAIFFETIYEAIKYTRQLLELDDQWAINYYGLCVNYNRLHQYDKAIPEGEKVLEIYKKWNSKPEAVWPLTSLGLAYHKTGQYKKEKKLYDKAEQDFPDNSDLIYRQAILSLTEGDTINANEYIKKYISVRRENSTPEANIITGLAGIYAEADIPDKAEEYFREAVSLEPEKPSRMNNLAFFLVDKDRDINEGLELVDRALESDPDNFNFLDTKGWCLFKQGKFKEALEILDKSWSLKPFYNHELYLHLEAAKKAVAGKEMKEGEKM